MEKVTMAELKKRMEQAAGPRGNDDVTLDGTLAEAATPRPAVELGLCERLKRRFGLGDDPRRRMVLYRRLETLWMEHGEIVWTLCAEAAAQAAGTNNPGRYFSKAVIGKLRDHKIVAEVKGGDL